MNNITLADCKDAAKAKGGRCLSEQYINNKVKMRWECSEGHQWEAPSNSIRRGTWCAKCSGVSRLTIDEMKTIAHSRGGDVFPANTSTSKPNFCGSVQKATNGKLNHMM
jgi:hypothetical protein